MKIIIPILIILITLNSCKKDEETPVLAGDVNLEMFQYKYTPALKIQLQIDSTNNIKYGKDSIDINQDGNYDLFILQNLFIDWEDTLHVEYFTFNNKLILKNNTEVVTNNETYYIGLGQTRDIAWVDAINYGIKINEIDDWSETDKTIFMWGQPPESTMSNGCWFNILNEEKYIGIRMRINSEYKYGWVKVNQDSDRNIVIQSYAIEK